MDILDIYIEKQFNDSFTGLFEDAFKEGFKKGFKEGYKKGIEIGRKQNKTDVVKNLITKLAVSDAQAADIAEVPIAFVKKIRASLNKKQLAI